MGTPDPEEQGCGSAGSQPASVEQPRAGAPPRRPWLAPHAQTEPLETISETVPRGRVYYLRAWWEKRVTMRPGSWQAENRSAEPPLMGTDILPPHTSALSRSTPFFIVFLSPPPPSTNCSCHSNSCEKKTNLEILGTPLVPKRKKGKDSVKPLREANLGGRLYP